MKYLGLTHNNEIVSPIQLSNTLQLSLFFLQNASQRTHQVPESYPLLDEQKGLLFLVLDLLLGLHME